MDKVKLNQSKLNRICYILGSYDYEGLRLEYSEKYVYIIFGSSDIFISKFILDEISEFMGDNFGCVSCSRGLALMFERESPNEILTIPEVFKTENV